MIRDLIKGQLVTVEPDSRVSEAAGKMAGENVGAVLVLSNGKPRGIFTDRDIVVRCIAKNIDVSDCTVEQVMTESLETVSETDGIFDCIKKMHDAKVRRIPVIDASGKAIGIISFGDLLAVLSREFYELTSTTTPAEETEIEDKLAA